MKRASYLAVSLIAIVLFFFMIKSDFLFALFWPYYQYFLAFIAWLTYVAIMFERQEAKQEVPVEARALDFRLTNPDLGKR